MSSEEKSPLLKSDPKEVRFDLRDTEGSGRSNASESGKVEYVRLDEGDEDRPESGQGICHPSGALFRYGFLVMICLPPFGSYLCFDMPAALQGHMLTDLNLTESQYMAFYSWYMWPCTVMALLGGYLLDRIFGNRTGLVLFTAIVTIAQFLFATGVFLNVYPLMCLGRAVFGAGDIPYEIAIKNFAVKWYQGKELNMVFGCITSAARVGSVVGLNVMETLYTTLDTTYIGATRLGIVLFIGATVMFVAGFLDVSFVACLDKWTDRQTGKDQLVKASRSIHVKDVIKFPVSYWLNVLTTTVFYLGVFPFIALGSLYFESKYGLSPQAASSTNSLVYVITVVSMPMVGALIDRTGKNLFWLLAGIVLSVSSHAMFAFTFVNPTIPVVVLGLGYSTLTTVVWPLVSLIVDADHLGTAFGIMNGVISIGQAAGTTLTGYIVDHHGYLILELFFISSICVSMMSGVLLYVIDTSKGGYLNQTASRRENERKLKKANCEKGESK